MRDLPHPPEAHAFITVRQDVATRTGRHGTRWYALHTSTPGDTTGLPVRDARGEQAECRTLIALLSILQRHHGAVPGDVHRAFLPRFDGKGGSHPVPARQFPYRGGEGF